ncbi:hypothetical protein L914_01908 [Phytophthora nicotianae]|uniref:Uncharacterized protein n=2 Tax=Phytophthora nicotianae TaxID=4792 RepID=V9E2H4_PHYNI|nr:hypothetical protein F443_20146 [Phytophthora nicotianae P1569]ETM54806.1 hypothetical protein L914_01908 [Phytophthora nicotianae]
MHSKKKLLLCPDEREIVRDTLVGIFTLPPPPALERNADSEADGDDDDPGNGADGEKTMALWSGYLDEVFEDEELDRGYEEAHSTLNQHVEDDSGEFEVIALPALHEFPRHNDPAFPQEES